MSSLEERVAYLEGRFEDHIGAMGDLRNAVADLGEQIGRRFEQIDRRFEGVDARFVALDHKIDRHFTWLVGIQMAALVAVVGALVGSYYR